MYAKNTNKEIVEILNSKIKVLDEKRKTIKQLIKLYEKAFYLEVNGNRKINQKYFMNDLNKEYDNLCKRRRRLNQTKKKYQNE